jgi:type I restriction enzyme M protein
LLTGKIRNEIDKLWETFWTGGISDPLTVIQQITYLIFLRRLDEMQTLKEKQANLLGVPITDPIYTDETERLRWSRFREEEPENMYNLFKNGIEIEENGKLTLLSAFDFMKTLATDDTPFAKYLKDARFSIGSPRLLDKAIQMLDKIDMNDRDTKGDLYEYLLSKIASAGKNGQFRTPRHIIRMMVEMMQPTLEETVCDPSAGSCGFLVGTDDFIREHHPNALHDEQFQQHRNEKMFTGVEFDENMIRIGAMNMMLHGIERPNLVNEDALSEDTAHIRDQFSLILANPPFKGSLDYGAVDEPLLKIVKTKKTELLFLVLMLKMMKIGGRTAVIVPDGVLFGSSKAHRAIREEIVLKQQLQAVISMPSGVFKPYAGVSTAVLVFTRTDSGGTDRVWFYDMQADGYSLDDKRSEAGYRTAERPTLKADEYLTEFAKGDDRPEAEYLIQKHTENNIHDILQQYAVVRTAATQTVEDKAADTAYQKALAAPRTAQAFFVPRSEIEENDFDLSINRYKEIVYEEVEYEKPAVILGRIEEVDKEREALRSALEMLLKTV